MSFIEIRKSLGRKQYMSGVWVGIRKMKGRLGIIIIIRPDILQKMDIKVGDMVTVLRGEEEHRGILCLKKGPGFVLTKHDKGGVTGKITLTAWPGIINKSLRIKKVNVSTENDQITLDISRLLASTTSGDDHEI